MIFKRKKESAEDLLRTETGFVRYLRPYENMLVSFIAVSWAVYQLALASVLILDSTQQRAIHLAFAMSLLFLVNPCLKRPLKYLRFLSITDHIPIIDYIFAVVGAMAALYLVFDYEGIAMRMGVPITRDIIVGVILVILLLETTRRIIGPALPVIAILFTSYAFLGPYMPDVLAFKGVSITKYLSNITLSTEGIYGIPLGVSSSIVYLFVLMGGLNKIVEDSGFPKKKLKIVLKVGHPFDALMKVVKEEEIDLVVIGAKGRIGPEHILLGSVAEKMIRHSPVPVLTFRSKKT
jgi:TRAP-type uncharacterized transport system fused permease subunit